MEKNNVENATAALMEINRLVVQLDPSIRSAAFEILRPYFFGQNQASQKTKEHASPRDESDEEPVSQSGIADFISRYDHKKPADNVMLLAAWLYATYGVYPITAKELKELGDSCGLILPGRSDNTMRFAKNNGKALFNQQGKGWQPTVSGELFFKDEYNVKKGTKPPPKA